MKVLRGLLIVVAVIVVAVLGVGWVLPDTAHVERSVVINAKPVTVYTALNGFRQFNKWSPWASLDPGTQYVVEGPTVGVGAKQIWRSTVPGVGAGSQEILEAVPFERIVVKLVFEGFGSDNLVTYTLSAAGEGTAVTWAYDSVFHGDLMSRYFGLMLDRMIGPDYERGLASLKSLVEGLPQTDFSTLMIEPQTVESQPIVYVSAAAEPAEAAAIAAAAYEKLAAHLAANNLQQAAPPIAITRQYDDETGFWRFDAAMIVDRAEPPAAPERGIRSGSTYAGPVLRVTHKGPPSAMEPTYNRLIAYRTVAGFEDNGDSWEQHIAADGAGGEEITHIYWPVR